MKFQSKRIKLFHIPVDGGNTNQRLVGYLGLRFLSTLPDAFTHYN